MPWVLVYLNPSKNLTTHLHEQKWNNFLLDKQTKYMDCGLCLFMEK